MTIDAGLAVVLAAAVGLLSAVIVALINSRSQNKKIVTEIAQQFSLIAYRLDQVEKTLTSYNNFTIRWRNK